MNRIALILLLIALAIVVPLSSRRPDAIQHVLGLPGGVDSARKAMLGILVAVAAAMTLGIFLKRTHKK